MQKPNILFILSDDQGVWAMGCAGNSEIRTPNLDRLAETGLRFENFFCASPVCSPARASILTGRIPSYHGIHDWIRRGCLENPGDFAQYGREDKAIDYLAGIQTYPEILAENGYSCALSGKWHLGDHENPKPGFSKWFCHGFGGGPYYNGPMLNKGERVLVDQYITDAITDRALTYMDAMVAEKHPFYLGVHYTAPHSPWSREHHPEETWDDYYHNCPMQSTPEEPKHPWQRNDLGKNRREALAGYFTAITEMDRNIGRLLKQLEKHGILEDTLVIFTSDNGMNMGHHGAWGKGNATFPMNMYDTSVKVPFIVSQPGTVPAGKICPQMVSHYDILPTLLEWTGCPQPDCSQPDCPQPAGLQPDVRDQEKLPGLSFAALLKGEETPFRKEVVVYDEYGPVRMIRTEEWKYVHRYPYGPHELYHLKADPEERINLMEDGKHSPESEAGKKLKLLRGRLEDWFLRYARLEQDGRGQGVTGMGQMDWVGPRRTEESFMPLQESD